MRKSENTREIEKIIPSCIGGYLLLARKREKLSGEGINVQLRIGGKKKKTRWVFQEVNGWGNTVKDHSQWHGWFRLVSL